MKRWIVIFLMVGVFKVYAQTSRVFNYVFAVDVSSSAFDIDDHWNQVQSDIGKLILCKRDSTFSTIVFEDEVQEVFRSISEKRKIDQKIQKERSRKREYRVQTTSIQSVLFYAQEHFKSKEGTNVLIVISDGEFAELIDEETNQEYTNFFITTVAMPSREEEHVRVNEYDHKRRKPKIFKKMNSQARRNLELLENIEHKNIFCSQKRVPRA